MSEVLHIDGRMGEGGGQVLRSALSLSVALGRPVHVAHIRGRRKKPGLLRQHLTALRASAAISGGEYEGGELGSSEVTFHPGEVRGGDFSFGIGSAGSTMLVLQTIVPPLLFADRASTVRLEGGTHNPMAPPFDFLALSYAPLLARMGAAVELELVRPGFFPSGGGEVRASIAPVSAPAPLSLEERGPEGRHHCEIGLAHLPMQIADREWETLRKKLHWTRDRRVDRDMSTSVGPGNVLSLRLEFENVTEVATAFGQRNVSGKSLALEVSQRARRYLGVDAPVGEHLADQLMVSMALLAGGTFKTVEPSLHTRTNADVIELFLPGYVTFEDLGARAWRVTVEGRSGLSR